MVSQNLKELSIEELKKREKLFAVLTYLLVGTLVVSLIFKNFKVGWISLPLILLGTRLGAIQKELKARTSADETQI